MPTDSRMSAEISSEARIMEVVCAVLFDQQGKVLVCQRPEGKMLAGKWEFPGGKVDAGESFEEALHREMHEELDCEVLIRKKLSPVLHAYESLTIRLHPFVCSLGEDQPRALEHAAIFWVESSELNNLDLACADREIANELLLSS